MFVELRRDGDMFTCALTRDYLSGVGIDLDAFLQSIDREMPDTQVMDWLVNMMSIEIANQYNVTFQENESVVVTFDGPYGGDYLNMNFGVGAEFVNEQRELLESLYGEGSVVSRDELIEREQAVIEPTINEYTMDNINKRFGYTFAEGVLSVIVEFSDIEDVIAVSRHFGDGDAPGSLMTHYEGRYFVEVGIHLEDLEEGLREVLKPADQLTYEDILEMIREYQPEEYEEVLAFGFSDEEIEELKIRYSGYVGEDGKMSRDHLFNIALDDLERIASILCEYGNLSGISPYILDEYGTSVIEGDVFGDLNDNFSK